MCKWSHAVHILVFVGSCGFEFNMDRISDDFKIYICGSGAQSCISGSTLTTSSGHSSHFIANPLHLLPHVYLLFLLFPHIYVRNVDINL